MAAVSTEAPTPPDPPTTPMMCAVFMRQRWSAGDRHGHGIRQLVDRGANREGVVDGPRGREEGTAPDGGTSGAVGAPTSGGRDWRAGTLDPEGECAPPMMSDLAHQRKRRSRLAKDVPEAGRCGSLTQGWHPAKRGAIQP